MKRCIYALSLILLTTGCTNQMVAKLGGTPRPERSQYFTVTMCGTQMTTGQNIIKSYITLKIHENAPKPLYLAVTFETPAGSKVVSQQVSIEDYANKRVTVESPPAKGWKPRAYMTSVDVFSDAAYTHKVDYLAQPWRNYYDYERVFQNMK